MCIVFFFLAQDGTHDILHALVLSDVYMRHHTHTHTYTQTHTHRHTHTHTRVSYTYVTLPTKSIVELWGGGGITKKTRITLSSISQANRHTPHYDNYSYIQ